MARVGISVRERRQRTAMLVRIASRAYWHYRRQQFPEMGQIICDGFVEMGGVYVKFLQGVLVRSALIKNWQSPERLRVFEDLGAEPIDVIEVLKKELTPQALAQIAEINPISFAAGSFGQVYMARLKNDKKVIVKILRPKIRESLIFDLKLLSRWVRLTSGWLTANIDIDFVSAFADFKRQTIGETNYREEVRFAREMFEHYKGHPFMVIPETYEHLCSDTVIVQEYIEGISLAKLIMIKESGGNVHTYVEQTIGSDLNKQLYTLGYESLYGVFAMPRIQGDPHPGNVRLLSGNRVGLIDFGISARSPKHKGAFLGVLREYEKAISGDPDIVAFFGQFLRFFVGDLYVALKTISKHVGKDGVDTSDLTEHVGNIAKYAFDENSTDMDMRELFSTGNLLSTINATINSKNRFGIIMQLEASDVMRAAQTYAGMVFTLGAQEIMPSVFHDVVMDVTKHQHKLGLHLEQDNELSIQDALDIISRWLERVAEKDPQLFQMITKRVRV